MSALDLTAAVEAAARVFAADRGIDDRSDADPIVRHQSAEIVLPYVTAAAPLIEAAVREQIAAEIDAEAARRAAQRDLHRDIAITRRSEGKGRAHDAHLRTALSFRSEATGMWDAGAIARGPR